MMDNLPNDWIEARQVIESAQRLITDYIESFAPEDRDCAALALVVAKFHPGMHIDSLAGIPCAACIHWKQNCSVCPIYKCWTGTREERYARFLAAYTEMYQENKI
jgi:hypothetical protein